jgi:hypothetical protein
MVNEGNILSFTIDLAYATENWTSWMKLFLRLKKIEVLSPMELLSAQSCFYPSEWAWPDNSGRLKARIVFIG